MWSEATRSKVSISSKSAVNDVSRRWRIVVASRWSHTRKSVHRQFKYCAGSCGGGGGV